jgi:hypothetical protein
LAIKGIVKKVFPEKNITSATFRRIFPSLCYAEKIHKEGQSFLDFVSDLAMALNTSSRVSEKVQQVINSRSYLNTTIETEPLIVLFKPMTSFIIKSFLLKPLTKGEDNSWIWIHW